MNLHHHFILFYESPWVLSLASATNKSTSSIVPHFKTISTNSLKVGKNCYEMENVFKNPSGVSMTLTYGGTIFKIYEQIMTASWQ